MPSRISAVLQQLCAGDVPSSHMLTSALSRRLVETNVAIIVGCMPACAQFLAPLSSGTSTFFKSLRSRLLGSTQRGSRSSTAPGSGKGAVSGGSSSEYVGKASKNSYGRISDDSRRMHEYEMHDTWPLRTPPATKTASEHSGGDRMV